MPGSELRGFNLKRNRKKRWVAPYGTFNPEFSPQGVRLTMQVMNSHDRIMQVDREPNRPRNLKFLHHSSSRDGSQKRKASVTADHSGANKHWMNQRNLMKASIRNHRVYLYIRDIMNISKFNTCQTKEKLHCKSTRKHLNI